MSDSAHVHMAYMTASSVAEAEKIANALIHHRAAACVNILGEVKSVYEWKGKIEHAVEIAFVAKTTGDRMIDVERIVREIHSYECPYIVSWRIEKGHEPFLNWVRSSTRQR